LNQFRNNISPEETPINDKLNAADEAIKKASDFTFFIKKESLSKFIPAIIIVVFLSIVYISLSHFHVKNLKEKEDLKKQLNELRSEYISVKSNLMKKSNQSEVAKRLETEGIKELRTPPKVIEMKKK
jgi:predicted membrane protein